MENLEIVNEALANIKNAESLQSLEIIRLEYLGKKGQFSLFMQNLKTLPVEQKPIVGAQINQAKKQISQAIALKKKQLEELQLEKKLVAEKIDVTLPGRMNKPGSVHPITQTIERILDYFFRLGYCEVLGPEIEDNYYNFTALNIPDHHPARAMHDTFYINVNTVLRTHTSPVQIRALEKYGVPIAVVCPGKVYRCDSDQTHSPMFHQIEALYIAEQVSFATLKTLLIDFLKYFFANNELAIRFRPSYFPFTEPSAEVDIGNDQKWLEVLGCGMVHPQVLQNAGLSERWQGFALGLGVERFAMLRYGINDLRYFFENDLRFLEQFI